jgi:hypothetical protein
MLVDGLQVIQPILTASEAVIPAKAGIHISAVRETDKWAPAFAGATTEQVLPLESGRSRCYISGHDGEPRVDAANYRPGPQLRIGALSFIRILHSMG